MATSENASTRQSNPRRKMFASPNSIALLCCLLLCALPVTSQYPQSPVPGPFTIYKTEPSFIPSAINVSHVTNDPSLLADGYYFVAPHMGHYGWGPQILDQRGELIWYGQPSVRELHGNRMNAMDFQRCDYLGQRGNHLCFSEAQPDVTDHGYRSIGANRILNDQYLPEGPAYSKAGSLWFPNPHEFQMIDGGNSFVQSVYQLREMDLRPYAGKKEGYVYDGCFQEIDTRTREEIFVWCSFDHFPVWQTYVFLHTTSNKANKSTPTGGKGTRGDPWDPVHLNSVDKNEENDYLVSNRHMSQVLKIAGLNNVHGLEPGSIIWRFGGYDSTFDMDDDVTLGYQHHARFVSTTSNETIFTVFDNRGIGGIDDDLDSEGLTSFKTIKVNNVTKKAELLRIDPNAYSLLSIAQGSAQILPNGNALAGWGSEPSLSEFSPNGTLLFHAEFYTSNLIGAGSLTNYRAFKHPWVGRPAHPPKLIAYCNTCNPFRKNIRSRGEDAAPLIAWVSWNGATEVASWRFHVSARAGASLWLPAGTFPRTSFETRAELRPSAALAHVASFAPYVSVQALDASGNVLASVVQKTFVPRKDMAVRCDDEGCFQPERFAYDDSFNRSDECGETYTPEVLGLLLLFVAVELGAAWVDGVVGSVVSRQAGRRERRASWGWLLGSSLRRRSRTGSWGTLKPEMGGPLSPRGLV